MKKCFKKPWVAILLLMMLLMLVGCGGGGDSEPAEETEAPTEAEVEAPEPKAFTTNDGKYTFSVTGSQGNPWEEAAEYANEDTSLELDNAKAMSFISVLSQEKEGLGYTLDTYNDETMDNQKSFYDSVEIQSQEDITVAGCPAIMSLLTFTYDGLGYYSYLTVIETDEEFIQLNVHSMSTDSELIKGFMDEMVETFVIN